MGIFVCEEHLINQVKIAVAREVDVERKQLDCYEVTRKRKEENRIGKTSYKKYLKELLIQLFLISWTKGKTKEVLFFTQNPHFFSKEQFSRKYPCTVITEEHHQNIFSKKKQHIKSVLRGALKNHLGWNRIESRGEERKKTHQVLL